jgi:hypothetical protein
MGTQSTSTKGFVVPLPERARSREILRKRIKRLLELDRDKTELRTSVLPFLESLGSVALIGGAIRDVARAGKRGFSSDYDFVIYGSDRSQFATQMELLQGVRNRFGGYAVKRFKMKIDVWHIEDTWAHTEGHTRVSRPDDLLHCTFFDWDSVVYDLASGRLILPDDYFLRLQLNVMDIRLEPNPNPVGSLVRALRRAALWHVRFGSRLTAFTRRLLLDCTWNDIVDLDMRAFAVPVLYRLNREALLKRLSLPELSPLGEVTLPVPPTDEKQTEQLVLPL